ncbi:hypothetical protein [Paenibacillus pini]|uniref:Uncharacterized protein n=1 Tax=Paenibacillus pini JCM 16418 TaxID=1236976 RepID=W7YQG5_9BACL|nr:hypothetical protein [Paenibacillus pini]GAF10787.1 hypothetical protein JCM16418_5008 [Paenibacillus pini JCM 16418]
MKPYDEEKHEYLILEMMNAEDVALNGEEADTIMTELEELPSPEVIAEQVKRAGFDTFEVTLVKETVKRYQV